MRHVKSTFQAGSERSGHASANRRLSQGNSSVRKKTVACSNQGSR